VGKKHSNLYAEHLSIKRGEERTAKQKEIGDKRKENEQRKGRVLIRVMSKALSNDNT